MLSQYWYCKWGHAPATLSPWKLGIQRTGNSRITDTALPWVVYDLAYPFVSCAVFIPTINEVDTISTRKQNKPMFSSCALQWPSAERAQKIRCRNNLTVGECDGLFCRPGHSTGVLLPLLEYNFFCYSFSNAVSICIVQHWCYINK